MQANIEKQKKVTGWRSDYCWGEPMQIGNEIQFVFDDYIVEDRFGLKRRVKKPLKHLHNPVLCADRPWEDGVSNFQVLYDSRDKIYKAWYGVNDREAWTYQFRSDTWIPEKHGYPYMIAYAESKDGIHWEKPDLDQVSYKGFSRTNLLITGDLRAQAHCIGFNPDQSDPDRRFMMTYKDQPPGENQKCILKAYSADGIHWTYPSDSVVIRGCTDGVYRWFYDEDSGSWFMYSRPRTLALMGGDLEEAPDTLERGTNYKRRAAVSLSRDMKEWSYFRTLFLPDELDASDVDSIRVVKHKNIFLGFIGLMDNLAQEPKYQHIMFSRDGLAWERLPDRPRYIDNGQPGEWDAGQISEPSFVQEGRRIHMYYRGDSNPQGIKEGNQGGIGLARTVEDRFIGQYAGQEGGYLLTREFILDGNRLVLNLEPLGKNIRMGHLRAEILKPPAGTVHSQSVPFDGYSMADCNVIKADATEHVVKWNGSGDLSSLCGERVYIRFYLENAMFYTFRIGGCDESL